MGSMSVAMRSHGTEGGSPINHEKAGGPQTAQTAPGLDALKPPSRSIIESAVTPERPCAIVGKPTATTGSPPSYAADIFLAIGRCGLTGIIIGLSMVAPMVLCPPGTADADPFSVGMAHFGAYVYAVGLPMAVLGVIGNWLAEPPAIVDKPTGSPRSEPEHESLLTEVLTFFGFGSRIDEPSKFSKGEIVGGVARALYAAPGFLLEGASLSFAVGGLGVMGVGSLVLVLSPLSPIFGINCMAMVAIGGIGLIYGFGGFCCGMLMLAFREGLFKKF